MRQIYYHICFNLRRSQWGLLLFLLLVLLIQILLPLFAADRGAVLYIDGNVQKLMVEFDPMIRSPLWIGFFYCCMAAGLLLPVYLIYTERMPQKSIYALLTLPIPRTHLYLAKYLAGVLVSWFVYAIEILAAFALFAVYCLTTSEKYTVTMGLFRSMLHPSLLALFPFHPMQILANLLVLAMISGVILLVSIDIFQQKRQFLLPVLWFLTTALFIFIARKYNYFIPFVQNVFSQPTDTGLLYLMGAAVFAVLSLGCIVQGWRRYICCDK